MTPQQQQQLLPPARRPLRRPATTAARAAARRTRHPGAATAAVARRSLCASRCGDQALLARPVPPPPPLSAALSCFWLPAAFMSPQFSAGAQLRSDALPAAFTCSALLPALPLPHYSLPYVPSLSHFGICRFNPAPAPLEITTSICLLKGACVTSVSRARKTHTAGDAGRGFGQADGEIMISTSK